MGHRVTIHNITSVTVKERGDLEIKDYVVLQKPQTQANRLPPPRTLTNTRRSDGAPDPDGALKEVARIKIRHYRNVYLNHPDPISFIPLPVDTTGHLYDEFIRLLFLHDHREISALANEFPEESVRLRT